MLSDQEKAKLFTEPQFLHEQEDFAKHHCGNIEACFTTIEGLSSLLVGWSHSRVDQVVSKEEIWGIYIVGNMLHDLSVIGQRILERR